MFTDWVNKYRFELDKKTDSYFKQLGLFEGPVDGQTVGVNTVQDKEANKTAQASNQATAQPNQPTQPTQPNQPAQQAQDKKKHRPAIVFNELKIALQKQGPTIDSYIESAVKNFTSKNTNKENQARVSDEVTDNKQTRLLIELTDGYDRRFDKFVAEEKEKLKEQFANDERVVKFFDDYERRSSVKKQIATINSSIKEVSSEKNIKELKTALKAIQEEKKALTEKLQSTLKGFEQDKDGLFRLSKRVKNKETGERNILEHNKEKLIDIVYANAFQKLINYIDSSMPSSEDIPRQVEGKSVGRGLGIWGSNAEAIRLSKAIALRIICFEILLNVLTGKSGFPNNISVKDKLNEHITSLKQKRKSDQTDQTGQAMESFHITIGDEVIIIEGIASEALKTIGNLMKQQPDSAVKLGGMETKKIVNYMLGWFRGRETLLGTLFDFGKMANAITQGYLAKLPPVDLQILKDFFGLVKLPPNLVNIPSDDEFEKTVNKNVAGIKIQQSIINNIVGETMNYFIEAGRLK